jgi:ribosomal protein L11 methyltransferase
MVECVEIIFQSLSEQSRDLLIANLPELGFHGMEETEGGLIAYADVNEFNHAEFEQLCIVHALVFSQQIVKQQNWNALWESNFDPVFIPGQVHVRAHFHPPVEGFTHEILITPKMSFGTGHHQTTRLVCKEMFSVDFYNKRVLDMGCGTGILAILSKKRGCNKTASFHKKISN